MKRGILISAMSGLLLASCAVPAPKMEQPDASGIAISVKINMPLFGYKYAEKVFFVKLDSSGDIRQNNVISSNYNKDGRVYLLNATPGEYVAVAASIPGRSASPAPAAPGLSVTITATRQVITFFQKDVVEQIRVNVGNGQIVCAGNYALNTSTLGERDLIQRHYETVILKLDEPLTATDYAMRGGGWGGPASWRGTLHEAKNDDNTKGECIRRAKEDLAEGGWHAVIK